MKRYNIPSMPPSLLIDMVVRDINGNDTWTYDTQESVTKALAAECADPQGKLTRMKGRHGGIFRRDDIAPTVAVKSDKVCQCGKPNDHDAKKCWMCERVF